MVITKADLSRELKVTKACISQFLKAGMPVRVDGKLDREVVLEWVARRRSSDRGGWRFRGKVDDTGQVAAAALEQSAAPAQDASPASSSTERSREWHDRLAQAKTLEAERRLREKELEGRQRSGELLLASDVAMVSEAAARSVTDHWMNFAGRVSAELAAALGTEERKVYNQLERLVRRHLAEKSEAMEAAA